MLTTMPINNMKNSFCGVNYSIKFPHNETLYERLSGFITMQEGSCFSTLKELQSICTPKIQDQTLHPTKFELILNARAKHNEFSNKTISKQAINRLKYKNIKNFKDEYWLFSNEFIEKSKEIHKLHEDKNLFIIQQVVVVIKTNKDIYQSLKLIDQCARLDKNLRDELTKIYLEMRNHNKDDTGLVRYKQFKIIDTDISTSNTCINPGKICYSVRLEYSINIQISYANVRYSTQISILQSLTADPKSFDGISEFDLIKISKPLRELSDKLNNLAKTVLLFELAPKGFYSDYVKQEVPQLEMGSIRVQNSFSLYQLTAPEKTIFFTLENKG